MQAKVARMLPVLHKYDMQHFVDECEIWLADPELPFSSMEKDDAYVLR